MKKITAVCLVIVMILSMRIPITYANDQALGYEFDNVEEASAYIMRNILFKSMKMEGENRQWSAELVVGRTLTSGSVYKPFIQLTLQPKTSDLTWITYSVITDNGYISDNVWQIYQKPIVIKSYRILPSVGEQVILCLKSSTDSQMEVLLLEQIIPEWIKVTPQEAIRIFVNEYYAIFNKYPADNFTYEMEIYNNHDWIVSFDDNDNIGGWAYLFINGVTGEPGGMKIEE